MFGFRFDQSHLHFYKQKVYINKKSYFYSCYFHYTKNKMKKQHRQLQRMVIKDLEEKSIYFEFREDSFVIMKR